MNKKVNKKGFDKGRFKNFDLNIELLNNCVELLNTSLDLDEYHIYLALLVFRTGLDSFINDFEVKNVN